jgi:uracil-DNA glycosylase family protein
MASSPKHSALEYFPEKLTYNTLRDSSMSCHGCDLYKLGTQTVFGEGPRDARVMMIGEQPGNEEDLEGHPFVGPAGRLLDKALVEAGIDRETVYMTNAVKHFKWKPQGKRRLHQKPNASDLAACKPWLYGELEVIHPEFLVCLGATAAQAMLGPDFRVTKMRGQWLEFEDGQKIIATIHPSAVLRAGENREQEYRAFVADLAIVARALA